ncbi:MAG TPA: polyprenyl synthetase family protein, partial [Pirellulales bacterium]
CLNVLEKAFDKILLAGIPCMAVPLLSSDCRNTSVDEDWVMEQIKLPHVTQQAKSSSYLPLMRAAADLFKPDSLQKLSPRLRGAASTAQGLAGVDPIAATEAIAHDFMAEGGKHMRPFGTLAVYDALTGGHGTQSDGAEHLASTSDSVRRTALAMEAFHKASLVHDDIQDDDAYRYGAETLHRKFGIPTAINVGDYLIGLGYRLLSRCKGDLGAEATMELVDRLADAHLRLSEGQGAELVWRDAKDKRLAPIDALKIYALKTSPAFEAALMSGVRLAGSTDAYRESIPAFCKHVGVAFQILNDLKDWKGDDDNKLGSAGDVIGGRPTVLWALALEALAEPQRQELLELAAAPQKTPAMIARVRALYEQARVFDKAARLVDKYQEKAEATADEIQPDELRRLLYYFIDTVLDRSSALPDEKPALPIVALGAPKTVRS